MTTKAREDLIRVVSSEEDEAATWLSLGAQASLQAVLEAPDSPELFRHILTGVVTWQQRNETSVAQAVLSPTVAPWWVAALLALGAQVAFRQEQQEVQLGDFLKRVEPRRSKLAGVRLRLNVAGRVWGEAHVSRTPADKPIVAVIAAVDVTDGVVRQARLALTGVWREHARLADAAELLAGGALDEDHIQRVASAVKREVKPREDFSGSAEYRRAMAAVLTRRALEDCQRGMNRL
jgi:carbon-monoxide dehydrogenase medium subunit